MDLPSAEATEREISGRIIFPWSVYPLLSTTLFDYLDKLVPFKVKV
jgi:hypothetical protein